MGSAGPPYAGCPTCALNLHHALTGGTPAIIALANRGDPDHPSVLVSRNAVSPPCYIPAGILSGIGYMLDTTLPPAAVEAFVDDLIAGTYVLDCGQHDFPRIKDLMRRYRDLPLGLADASVIAGAERHGGATLTLDRRHLDVVARETKIGVLPAY